MRHRYYRLIGPVKTLTFDLSDLINLYNDAHSVVFEILPLREEISSHAK